MIENTHDLVVGERSPAVLDRELLNLSILLYPDSLKRRGNALHLVAGRIPMEP